LGSGWLQYQGGRIILDEPTNLPEGAEVRLMALDADDLDEQERRELGAAIAAAERELDLGQREATAQLDQWDGANFDRARAALDHRHPDQSAYVFDNLSAKSGAEAIGSVRTFLDRVAALRDGTDSARTSTRDADKAAAALLATRRIVDADEERRLRALIADATSLAELPVIAEPDPTKRQQTARKLDAWLRDWRETARVLITRRDHQIRLGLAERRAPKAEAAASTESVS
jgi:hypothetical protein